MRSTLLLLANDPDVLIDVASAARDAGYLVAPGRYHELGIDSLTRVDAQVALVHVEHDAADSLTFAALAQHRGTRVFLFASRAGAAEERHRVSMVSSRSPFPVIEYDLEPATLIQSMQERLTGR